MDQRQVDIETRASAQPEVPTFNAPTPDGRTSAPWSLRQTIAGILITLVPWLAFSLGTNALGGSSTTTSGGAVSQQVDIATGVAVFVISSLLEAVFLIAPLAIVWRIKAPRAGWRERLGWLGLRRVAVGPAVFTAIAGIVIAVGGSAIYSWIVSVLNLPLQTNTDTLLAQGRSQPFTVLGLLLAAALVAPICEELFFRGFAFVGLLKGMTLVPAVLLSASIFAVAHADLGSLIPLFIIGLVLAWARWRTDSLWPSIAIHTANNTIAALALLPLLFK